MNKYYIARNYRSKFDAAGKAKMDCETILERNGWKNIGFKQTWISNPLLGTLVSALGITFALIKLKSRTNLCLQYPLNKFYNYILWGARLKKCRIITIVHDVYALKGKRVNELSELTTLEKSDCLILHNTKMNEWFQSKKCNVEIIELGIFDYLHKPTCKQKRTPVNHEEYRIVFAGNMGGKKSFVYQFDDLDKGNYRLDLYGVGFDHKNKKNKNNSIINYIGCYLSNEVIDHIDGDFGLVWYGDSLDDCEGKTGNYLRFNNPHKLSLYLQCEMPIIIWEKAAMAKFVLDNKIGITVASLKEIPSKLSNLSTKDYVEMKLNGIEIKRKLSEGYYLKTALDNVKDLQL